MEPKPKRLRKHNRSRKTLAKKRDISGMNLTTDPRICLAQSECLLVTRLPPEVRRIIYEFLFDRDRLHIWLGNGLDQDTRSWARNRHCLCEDEGCGETTSAALFRHLCEKHWHRSSAVEYEASRFNFYKSQSECFEIIPLAQTCRRICSEVMDLLYARTTFYFEDTELLDGSGVQTPPRWLHQITTLETRIKFPDELTVIRRKDAISMDQYRHLLDSIASIRSLRNIRLRVVNSSDIVLYQTKHWWGAVSWAIDEVVKRFNGIDCEVFLTKVQRSSAQVVRRGTCKIYGREEIEESVRGFNRELGAYRKRYKEHDPYSDEKLRVWQEYLGSSLGGNSPNDDG